MKFIHYFMVLFFVCFAFSCKDKSDDTNSTPSTTTPLAFPHAEGGGKYTEGGRGGDVYYVTSLADDGGSGTFRYAVSQIGRRTVIFKVAGTIQLKSALNISHPYLTIAGQTAPGKGITIRDYPVYISASNVIIRFIRFRMGDVNDVQDDALGSQATTNVIIDHCSMSWSTDECGSFYDNKNFTLQWCILSESLNNSIHEKGTHGYGGIWGGQNATFHHNLLADHNSRNPRFDHNSISSITGPIDFENNVIYNWGDDGTYGGENRYVNIVNNYYKSGQATTSSSAKYRIFHAVAYDSVDFSGNPSDGRNLASSYYITGNYVYGYPAVTSDNWNGGVQLKSGGSTAYATFVSKFKAASPITMTYTITAQTAEAAYQSVLSYAGASYARDAVDTRIVGDVTNGTYIYQGSKGSSGGLIDTQSDVGGWPEDAGVIQATSSITDTDGDGMPDNWEDAKGLNKNDKSDGATKTLDGTYTNLEVYLNSLVESLYPY